MVITYLMDVASCTLNTQSSGISLWSTTMTKVVILQIPISLGTVHLYQHQKSNSFLVMMAYVITAVYGACIFIVEQQWTSIIYLFSCRSLPAWGNSNILVVYLFHRNVHEAWQYISTYCMGSSSMEIANN